tara:strand:+ start:905 stop:1618 length:714 start_codon:yes stop_codon:yes gene_type:complete
MESGVYVAVSFKKNKYCIIRKAISKELANFIYNYFLIKRQVSRTLFDENAISPFSAEFGVWNDIQAPDTFSHYSDVAMETLLLRCQPLMEKHTGLKLLPTYSYARIYKNGDILKRHKDRKSCEVSTTMFLGGDFWPIFLSPNENVGIHDGPNAKPGTTFSSDAKGVKVDLKHGDMLVYDGVQLEHWREVFTGQACAQVFLHYNTDTPQNKQNMFDTRPHLGLPSYFQRAKRFKAYDR